jgi:hypothetical protein
VQVYLVKAAANGDIVDIATADSAKLAMIRYLDAVDQYDRAWVSDDSGKDILIDDLVRLAQQEGP